VVPPVAAVKPSGAFARLLADRWAMAGAAVAVAFVLLAVFAPLICRINGSDPYTYNLGALAGSGLPQGAFGGVSASHWLGVEPQTLIADGQSAQDAFGADFVPPAQLAQVESNPSAKSRLVTPGDDHPVPRVDAGEGADVHARPGAGPHDGIAPDVCVTVRGHA